MTGSSTYLPCSGYSPTLSVTTRKSLENNTYQGRKVFVESRRELPRSRRLVGVEHIDNTTQPENSRNKQADLVKGRRSAGNPGVLMERKATHHVLILVRLSYHELLFHIHHHIRITHRLSKVPPLLLIPPVSIRIAELAFLKRRIDITTVLDMTSSVPRPIAQWGEPTMPGSKAGSFFG